jgi:histidine ammonia-lyase
VAGTDPVSSDGTVRISAEPLALGGLLSVAHGARLELDASARQRIEASRAIVDAAVEGPDLVYGLNTGLGHMRNERVPLEVLEQYQVGIVAGHVGAIGAPLPRAVVRAAIAARVNGIARGGSGASPRVADALVALLNAGVTPIVPASGSVGASDLMHMAAIGQVARGAGLAEFEGEIVDGGEALRRAGLDPVHLGPKDGLTLISANGVAIGHGALVVERAVALAEAADAVFVATFEALGGNTSIVDPVVAEAKGIAGQARAADHIRALLEGSERCAPGAALSVQDPLSLRVVPQVHGALREFVGFAERAVEAELNAIDDNPLVSLGDGRLISNGNFHPMVLALAFDALRPAIAHAGQLADRRMNHLWTVVMASIEMTAESLDRLATSGALLRYTAAARAADMRFLAAPATLDVGALDLGVEDHATNAPATVARTDEALDALADVLAIELLSARFALRDAGRTTLGRGTGAILEAVDELERAATADPAPGIPVERVQRATSDALAGPIRAAAQRAIGIAPVAPA